MARPRGPPNTSQTSAASQLPPLPPPTPVVHIPGRSDPVLQEVPISEDIPRLHQGSTSGSPAPTPMELIMQQLLTVNATLQAQHTELRQVREENREIRQRLSDFRAPSPSIDTPTVDIPETDQNSVPGTSTAIREHVAEVQQRREIQRPTSPRPVARNRSRAESVDAPPIRNNDRQRRDRPRGRSPRHEEEWMGGAAIPREQRNNPLSDAIMAYELPRISHPVNIEKYDGTTDPSVHLSRFRIAMIPNSRADEVMCRMFAATLSDNAIHWFESLPQGSISNFRQLEDAFIDHFSVNGEFHYHVTSLFDIIQGPNEPLRDYMQRMGEAISKTRNVTSEAATHAAHHGLNRGPFRYYLSKRAVNRYSEFRRIAAEFIDAEDSLVGAGGDDRPLDFHDIIPGGLPEASSRRPVSDRLGAPQPNKGDPLRKDWESIYRQGEGQCLKG